MQPRIYLVGLMIGCVALVATTGFASADGPALSPPRTVGTRSVAAPRLAPLPGLVLTAPQITLTSSLEFGLAWTYWVAGHSFGPGHGVRLSEFQQSATGWTWSQDLLVSASPSGTFNQDVGTLQGWPCTALAVGFRAIDLQTLATSNFVYAEPCRGS